MIFVETLRRLSAKLITVLASKLAQQQELSPKNLEIPHLVGNGRKSTPPPMAPKAPNVSVWRKPSHSPPRPPKLKPVIAFCLRSEFISHQFLRSSHHLLFNILSSEADPTHFDHDMVSPKFLIAILFTIISHNCVGQNNCSYEIDVTKILLNENLDSFLLNIQREFFQNSQDKKDIPPFIKTALDCWTSNFSIANPKEPFNATDLHYNALADRQLLFLAASKDLFIMTYWLGGIGESIHILFIKFRDIQITDVWTGVGSQKLKSIKQVLDYIQSHRYKDWGLNTNTIYF